MKKRVRGKRSKKLTAVDKAAATRLPKSPSVNQGIQAVKAVAYAIVAEIINEMNLALATVGKSFSPNALNEWEPKLRHSVWVKLMLGGNWMTDRTNVLTAAHDMAIIAAILAGPSAQVAKGYVHAAFRAAKDHSACPGGGSGAWCDFSI